MSERNTFTLPKQERLCSKKLIDRLFVGHSANSKEWPIKVVYQVIKRKDEQDAQVEMLVSVSKRHFKRAVKRNLVKRQLREGYRLHKVILTDAFKDQPEAKLVIAFIWMSGHVLDTTEVETLVQKVMQKVVKGLDFQKNPVLE